MIDYREILGSREFKLFITFFFTLLFFSQWVGWDDDSRLALTRSIVDKGTLNIDSFYQMTSDRAFYDGHYYSDKAPGVSLLAVPSYAVLKLFSLPFPDDSGESYSSIVVGNALVLEPDNPGILHLLAMISAAVFVSALFSAISIVIVYRFSAHFTRNENYRILAALSYGFCTIALFYGTVFLGHATAASLGMIAFYMLFKAKHRRVFDRNWMVIAGAIAGFSVVVEYTHLIIFVLFAFYVVSFRRKSLPAFLAGFMVGIMPLLLYNAAIFGSPIELTYFHLDPAIWGEEIASIESVNSFSLTSDAGFLLWVIAGQFSPQSILHHLNVMFRLTFGLYRGLFIYSPLLLLGLYAMKKTKRKYRAETYMAIAGFLIFLWLASTPGFEWWGGAFFGPRHFMAILPLLFFPLMCIMEKIDRRVLAVFLLVSLTVSFSSLQHTEDIYGEGALGMSEVHETIMLSGLAPLGNPIIDHYIPLTLANGPRSRIFEGLVNWKTPDIRMFRNMSGMPYGNFAFLFYLIIVGILWRTELKPAAGRIKKLLENSKS